MSMIKILRNKRTTRFWIKGIVGFLGICLIVGGWIGIEFFLNVTKVSLEEGSNFTWPYYLHIPKNVARNAQRGEPIQLLILPNNTRTTHDDFAVHERWAFLTLFFSRFVFRRLEVVTVVPVFPRPKSAWRVYTHALDRDVLTTDIPDLKRLDLQLLGMLEDVRARLTYQGWHVRPKNLLWGFSASGMFVNRFTILHPDQVLAVAVGSPGGWPLAPITHWEGHCLRYPIGLCDLQRLIGKNIDLETYRRVPHFFFLGDHDTNDSVPYDDGYDDEDERVIRELFGSTPVERWEIAETLYHAAEVNATFRIYPGVGHRPTGFTEVTQFFSDAIRSSQE